METIIIAHIPVLHQGYKKLFESHPEAKKLYIIGPELLAEFPYLAKDIRQLAPDLVKTSIESWKCFDEVHILDKEGLMKMTETKPRIVLPNEDMSKTIVEKYLPKIQIEYSPLFLRWDKHNVVLETEVNPDRKISQEDFDKQMIKLADVEGQKSSDIWRRIGSVIVKDGKVIATSYNQAMPEIHTPMYEGDPRNSFHKGVNLELSIFTHSEALAIAQMARKGIAVEGAEIYVTTFPCPPCAKLIANAGFKRMFYANGYGVLDGERILKEGGVEIVKVEMESK
jgi:dCMP deaminase